MRTDVTVDEAREILQHAREQELAEQAREAKQYVGRCFRYRNCYSLPQGDEDYWYLYAIVQDVSPSGAWPVGLTFQRDNEGRISIREDEIVRAYAGSGWEEIDLAKFQAAADVIRDEVVSLLTPGGANDA